MDNNRRRKTVVFHIGDPKTGTSSIQKALLTGSVSHPDYTYASWRKVNATDVSGCLKVADRKWEKEVFEDLRRWISNNDADYSIISSEFFSAVPPGRLRGAISEFLPEHLDNTRVIAYARPHSSRFLAAYTQRVKTGLFSGSPDDFVSELGSSDILRYCFRFGRWRRNFKTNFVLRPFARERLISGDIVGDFFARVFRDKSFSSSSEISENSTLRVPSLVAIGLIQSELASLGVQKHLRSLLGGNLSNLHIAHHNPKGSKPFFGKATLGKIECLVRDDATKADARFLRNPFFLPELEKALDEATEETMELSPNAYYANHQIEEMRSAARRLSALLGKCGEVWEVTARAQRGVYVPTPDELLQADKHVTELQAVERELAALGEMIVTCPPRLPHS